MTFRKCVPLHKDVISIGTKVQYLKNLIEEMKANIRLLTSQFETSWEELRVCFCFFRKKNYSFKNHNHNKIEINSKRRRSFKRK